ncbi:shikimate dehydrogenase [Chthonobacter rhizosphaerae]|uniref:shikimate dehydrogenase n=1 Tax=Chthonobacter rhizosphaerae TaxID=2735553 RepID=UPI0015EE9048|nr:shikimate dehydrogenase [Chthonobacter rhizosphaerae]
MSGSSSPTVGVIGWPIAHSRSPLIHNHWMAVHRVEGRYDRLPVAPDAIEGFLADFPSSGLVGANVTIPYKEIAYRAVAERDPVAERLKAVNCLWTDGGRLVGANTDVQGFVGNLDVALPGWDDNPRVAFVLGAGGAARAVVDGLVHRGYAVRLANRTLARAESLAALYPGRVAVCDFADAARAALQADVVVNTTSLGMKGEGEIPLELHRLGPETIVADIVYVPLETPFLARARAAGLRTVDGLGMLLHQAVPSFEHWFGVRPVVTAELRALVEADLLS